LTLLVTGCSRDRTDLFASPSARLANPHILLASSAASAVEGQAVTVVAHRIQSGDSWIVGYREFNGGRRFGPTDQEYFVKLTLVFSGLDKPTGHYEFGGTAVQGYWSTGRVMNAGRTGAFAPIDHGYVDIAWLSNERFRIALKFDLSAQAIQPPSPAWRSIEFSKALDGGVKQVSQLTAWEGGLETTSPSALEVQLAEVMP